MTRTDKRWWSTHISRLVASENEYLPGDLCTLPLTCCLCEWEHVCDGLERKKMFSTKSLIGGSLLPATFRSSLYILNQQLRVPCKLILSSYPKSSVISIVYWVTTKAESQISIYCIIHNPHIKINNMIVAIGHKLPMQTIQRYWKIPK